MVVNSLIKKGNNSITNRTVITPKYINRIIIGTAIDVNVDAINGHKYNAKNSVKVKTYIDDMIITI